MINKKWGFFEDTTMEMKGKIDRGVYSPAWLHTQKRKTVFVRNFRHCRDECLLQLA